MRRREHRVRSAAKRASDRMRYGRSHQLIRRAWARRVAAGGVNCRRCGLEILPGTPFDLGHVDGDTHRYAGPEHRACNRATAGRTAGVTVRSQPW